MPNTKAEVSTNNDAFLGLVAFTGKTDISAEEAQATALATAMQMRKVEGIVTKAPLQKRTRKCTTYVNCGAYENLFDTTEKLELVHQNFGWGYRWGRDGAAANNTGWYHIGIFDTKGYKEPSNTYKGGERNYQYDIKIMINIQ